VFNYGIFRPESDNFIWHFILGHTDYELGVASTKGFCRYYKEWGSQVTEQVLDLTNEEKAQLLAALGENCKPENRIYRYNVFFDNCATRPRDIVVANLIGTVEYAPRKDFSPSFREMVRDCTVGHRWATFGNDILLGVRADQPTTQDEQQFLPINLRYDFDRAVVVRQGERKPLVAERRELVSSGVQMVESGFPLSPIACALMLLALSLAVLAYEQMKRSVERWFDIVLMMLTGLAGCILFMMLFSEHPATSSNLQLLLLNPLPLVFLWQVARGRKTIFFIVQLVLLVLFLVGGIWQSYAEGMYVVALCLATRIFRHRNDHKGTRMGTRKLKSLSVLLFLWCFSGSAVAQETAAAGVPRLVVSITVDQLRSDYLDAFTHLYCDGGFKRLISQGTVYGSVSYPFSPVDRASAIASVATGVSPYYNTIVGQRWLNRETLRPVWCVNDDRYGGLGTSETVSPEALSTSTLGDELKMGTEGRAVVWAVAPYSDAATLAAGHAADGAIWIDDVDGLWCTSQYYMKAVPQWVHTANTNRPPAREAGKGEHKYRDYKNSTAVNADITDMALRCIQATAMGRDDTPDLLSLTFYAGGNPQTGSTNMPKGRDALRQSYVLLDKEIERLIDGVHRLIGEGNTLFVVTSTGYCEETEETDYKKYRIPTGTFYMSRTADLLNMYLGAIWGNGKYVETTFRNHIFLNHDLLDQKKISIGTATTRAQELVVMMSGVRNVYTSLQLLTISNEQIQLVRQGYCSERCGDLVIETAPGWQVMTENTGESEYIRADFFQFPIIFYGPGIAAQAISQPVTTDRIAPTLARKMRIRAPNACSAEPLF
jgi:hypothetical protein